MVGTNLTEGSILKKLLIFAAPIVLTNLIQQMYSTVDLMVVGKFVGGVGTVGVSTGGELSDITTPIANAFATAGQIYIAQLTGAKETEKRRDAMITLITIMLCFSVAFTALPLFFHSVLLRLLNCPREALSEATVYMVTTAIGMPFIFGYSGVCAVLRGMGESKRPLLFVSISASVNVIMDLALVAVFHMGVFGAAIATVITQVSAFLAAYVFLNRHKEQMGVALRLSTLHIDLHALRVIFRLGIPQIIRSISVHFAMLWVKANVNSYGMLVSTTYSVGNKVEKLMNVFVQGVDSAAGAMIGQNLGARQINRVKRIYLTTLCCTMVCGTLVAILFLGIPKTLFRLFTEEPDVVEYGVVFLRIMAVGSIVGAFSGAFRSIATGAGEEKLCLIIGLGDATCRIAICMIFDDILKWGSTSYFWGAALCQLIPGLIALSYFISGKWKTKKLMAER